MIRLRFGYDSFSFHMGQVTAQGLPIRYIENEHMALDIDEPKDLEQFLSCGLDDGESTRVAQTLLAEQNAQAIRRLPGV